MWWVAPAGGAALSREAVGHAICSWFIYIIHYNLRMSIYDKILYRIYLIL